LLLSLFGKRAEGQIDSAQLAKCTEMLRGFILRRFVCGESSRGYGQMFVRALAKDEGNPLQTLEAYLLERGWPDDHQFQSAFVTFPLYLRGYTREVLETLERARGHKEPADLQGAQVEHVMPQTLSSAWVELLGSEAERVHADCLHHPGNLTLSAYNQELWNHPFGKKRERYADSNIVITRELSYYNCWGELEIRARGSQLAQEATRIWIGPKEQVARPKPDIGDDDDSPRRQELRQRFWSGLCDYLATEHPELPDFDPRPNLTIRIPSGIRHIGVDLRFGLKQNQVGVDVWFWREASLPVWEHIRGNQDVFNAIIDDVWFLEISEDTPRAWMSVNQKADLRDESCWPDLYRWLGEKLSLLYTDIAPKLREEMNRGV
jgi:hypothetical protein